MKFTSWIAGLVLLGATSGCFSHRFINRSVMPGGETHRSWGSFFLWGIAGHQTVDTREDCGQGEVHEVVLGTNFFTWLVSSITIGLYSPRIVVVRCGMGPVQVALQREPPSARGPGHAARPAVPATRGATPAAASSHAAVTP